MVAKQEDRGLSVRPRWNAVAKAAGTEAPGIVTPRRVNKTVLTAG
jgi:hypothetical protein